MSTKRPKVFPNITSRMPSKAPLYHSIPSLNDPYPCTGDDLRGTSPVSSFTEAAAIHTSSASD